VLLIDELVDWGYSSAFVGAAVACGKGMLVQLQPVMGFRF
jgi:hypothetical protein